MLIICTSWISGNYISKMYDFCLVSGKHQWHILVNAWFFANSCPTPSISNVFFIFHETFFRINCTITTRIHIYINLVAKYGFIDSKLVENQTSKKVKRLGTYNGLKYLNEDFKRLCISAGISKHTIIAETPQQNGLADKFYRNIFERVICMLIQAGLGKMFWQKLLYGSVLIEQ